MTKYDDMIHSVSTLKVEDVDADVLTMTSTEKVFSRCWGIKKYIPLLQCAKIPKAQTVDMLISIYCMVFICHMTCRLTSRHDRV